MSSTAKGFKLSKKDVLLYVCIFLFAYLGVMLWKYLSGEAVTWVSSFIFMFSIVCIYSLFKKISQKKAS